MILLEREAQLERLHGLLGEAARGRGRVVLLTGEAGAGKTSLVEAFGADLAHARILRSACEDLSIPDPLGPLYDLAREARWLAPRADEERRRHRLPLFSDALEAFETSAMPTVLVIEDLHWADDATLDFVRFLGRRVINTHILLVLTARNDGSDGQMRVRRALGEIPGNSIVRVDVPLLTEAAVSSLAGAAGRDGGAIYRVTAGNAFFVVELLCAENVAVPPASVRDAVVARADRLSPGARSMLEAVSVFPRRADVWALDGQCGIASSGQLAECVANGMLYDLGDGFAFRHEIARRAIEIALPPPWRRELNRRALVALRGNPNVGTARLVHHAVEANELEAIRELAPIAAREACLLGAHRDAAIHYQTALKQAEEFPVEERAALYEKCAFECHLIGHMEDAIAAQSQARRLHGIQGNRVKEGDSLRWLSRFSYLAGDRGAADDFGEQAVKLLEGGPDSPELAMAYSNLSHLAMLADKLPETVQLGDMAIRLAERLERSDIVCHALNNIGSAEQWLDQATGRLHLDRSLEMALAQNFQEHAARAFTNRACFEVNQLSYHEARLFLDQGISYCVEHDLDTWRDYMKGVLAGLLVRQGQWDEAASEALDVVNNERMATLSRFPAVMALARLRLRRGDPSTELLFAELARFLEKDSELQRLGSYAVLMAERAWLEQTDQDKALALIDRAEELAPSRAHFGELAVWRKLLNPGWGASDTAGMAAPYRQFLDGDWRSAAASWAAMNVPYERGLALLQGEEAAQRQALEIFEALGARPAAHRVREIMRHNGIFGIARGPRLSTRANSAGLTRRQMEVLHLIGQGLSNKRIADQLVIAPKTVDHHVSAVLEKLNAASRSQAIAIATASGLLAMTAPNAA